MILYGHPISQHVRRVIMLCKESDIPCDFKLVKLEEGEHMTPEFKKLNPNSMVPTIDDDGFILWESNTIMRYLCEKHKKTAGDFYPSAIQERANVDKWLDWVHTRLNPPVHTIGLNMLVLRDKADKELIATNKKTWIDEVLPVIETSLSYTNFLANNKLSIADLAAASVFGMAEMCQIDISKFPATTEWFNRIKSRNSFKETAFN